jgi:hypothetical protein
MRKLTVTTPKSSHSPSLLLLSFSRCFRLITFGVLFLGVCFHHQAAGQQQSSSQEKSKEKPYALLFGTVWGPDKRPLYGVKVKIRRSDQKKPKWELISDHSGEFAQRLPAGTADYFVQADVKSFKSLTGKELKQDQEVKVHIDNDERVDIGLHLK